jgi:hypothetical protein
MCRREEIMIKTIAIVGFLSLAVSFNSYAQGSDRIGHLETEIQELKFRVSKLESLLSNPGKTNELVPSGEGWKSVVNRRKLARGMDPRDVRQILGEPHRIDGGALETWQYQNGGEIVFYEGKVDAWKEPRK